MFNIKQPPVECEYTFYSDFQIADSFGEKGVRDTYRLVKNGWSDNPAAWGEVVCALNWRLWDLYETNEALAKIYQDLWQEAQDFGYETFKGEEATIFFRKVD